MKNEKEPTGKLTTSVQHAAELLDVDERWVRTAFEKGLLRGFRRAHGIKISLASIRELAEGRAGQAETGT